MTDKKWNEKFGDMKNTVELIGTYGSDTTHAMSAWTSTIRDLDVVEKKGLTKRKRIPQLLTFLAEEGHHTPFEKSALHFLCKTEIASHIHILKHRIGVSVNSESARYKELKVDKVYIPFDWPEDEIEKYLEHMEITFEKYHSTLKNLIKHYTEVDGMKKSKARKRAKESARFYLPYGNQLVCDVQFNFRSFMNFAKLRYSTHSQKEICNLAEQMLECVINIGDYKESLYSFGFTDYTGKLLPPSLV